MIGIANITLRSALGWAAVIALVLSTEFLFQPFVWRNWSLMQMGAAWVAILGDRLVVAGLIGAMIAGASRLPVTRPWAQVAALAMAMVLGASLGETMLALIDPYSTPENLVAVLLRVLRWGIIVAALVGLILCWRRGAALRGEVAQAQIDEARARQARTAAELEALRRQIEPHFLFNTLATIQRLQQVAPDQGRQLLARLCDFMSATVTRARSERSTLGDELDIVLAYLDVCEARMGGRLRVRADVSAELRDASFPPLLLATPVENSIKHGLAPLAEGGSVVISARVDAGTLEVVVADDGAGLTGQGGSGIGLANLAERLRLLHGAGASFRLQANEPRGARAIIRIPHATEG